MSAILGHAAIELIQNVLETNLTTTNDLTPDHCVALVTGGAVLGFDDRVHIDLDRAHTVAYRTMRGNSQPNSKESPM